MPFSLDKSTKEKGRKPDATGLITEYEGKTRVSIWFTEDFWRRAKKEFKVVD